MSRAIDPEAMTADDVEYVRQRPTLHREFIMQGLGDPLEPDYPGLIEDLDVGETDEEREARETKEAADEAARVAAEAEVARINAEAEAAKEAEAEGEVEESLSPEKQWNSDMTKAELRAVIEARNADYEDDEKIAMPEDKKAPLVAALEQDDVELFGDPTEE